MRKAHGKNNFFGGFSPASFGPAIGWYDAEDAILSGLNVDLVPNRITGPGAASDSSWFVQKPTFAPAGFAGQPAIAFSGGNSSQRLRQTSTSVATSWAIAMVLDGSNALDQWCFSCRSTWPGDLSAAIFWRRFFDANEGVRIGSYGDSPPFGPTATGPQVLIATKYANVITLYRDSINLGSWTDAVLNQLFIDWTIWGNSGGGISTRAFDGVIRAAFLFDGPLTKPPASLSSALHTYYNF